MKELRTTLSAWWPFKLYFCVSAAWAQTASRRRHHGERLPIVSELLIGEVFSICSDPCSSKSLFLNIFESPPTRHIITSIHPYTHSLFFFMSFWNRAQPDDFLWGKKHPPTGHWWFQSWMKHETFNGFLSYPKSPWESYQQQALGHIYRYIYIYMYMYMYIYIYVYIWLLYGFRSGF